MTEIKGERLYVALGASKVRRRLKGHGFGVRKVYSDGNNRAVSQSAPPRATIFDSLSRSSKMC